MVIAGSPQIQTPTTNNTAANHTLMADTDSIPLNFTTGNQVQGRAQRRTTFTPSTTDRVHQPTPNPVTTPERYTLAKTNGNWGFFHGATPSGVPRGAQSSLPNAGNLNTLVTPFFTNTAQPPVHTSHQNANYNRNNRCISDLQLDPDSRLPWHSRQLQHTWQ